MTGVMGWMAVMSLFEAKKIWDLREKQQLHTHPLFETARSWRTEERDSFGVVHRINTSELDDNEPLVPVGASGGLCGIICPPASSSSAQTCWSKLPSRCCPCIFSAGTPAPGEELAPNAGAYELTVPQPRTEQMEDQRSRRNQFLDNMDQKIADSQKTVRQLEEERQARETP